MQKFHNYIELNRIMRKYTPHATLRSNIFHIQMAAHSSCFYISIQPRIFSSCIRSVYWFTTFYYFLWDGTMWSPNSIHFMIPTESHSVLYASSFLFNTTVTAAALNISIKCSVWEHSASVRAIDTSSFEWQSLCKIPAFAIGTDRPPAWRSSSLVCEIYSTTTFYYKDPRNELELITFNF